MKNTAAFFLPLLFMLLFFVLIAVIIIISSRNARKKKDAFVLQATTLGYSYIAKPDGRIMAASSYNAGILKDGFTGVLPTSKNSFTFAHQHETRGSGKSRRDYSRTVVAIDIPDTQLQLIINSRINNDMQSGGNLQSYNKAQRIQVEGQFSDFFDIYMPATTQNETLTMLTPDSLLYILVNMSDYDIEIHGNKLFIYTYAFLWAPSLQPLIATVDGLLAEMRLRAGDIRREAVTGALVARTATDSSTAPRRLKRHFNIFSLVIIVAYVLFHIRSKYTTILAAALLLFFLVKLIITGQREQHLKKKYKSIVDSYRRP